MYVSLCQTIIEADEECRMNEMYVRGWIVKALLRTKGTVGDLVLCCLAIKATKELNKVFSSDRLFLRIGHTE